MKKLSLFATLMALLLSAQAHAAGVDFSGIQIDNLQPKSGDPINLSFEGLTSACAVNITSNVSGFTMPGGTMVQGGKLSFVPQSVFGTIEEWFTMTVSGGSYGQGCQGPAKTFNVQVNSSRVGLVGAETGTVALGQPVNVIVNGMPGRSCDGAALDFGDGTPVQQVSGAFPIKTSHVYTQAGAYKQNVKANGATCWGSAVSDFNTTVLDSAGMTQMKGLQAMYGNAQKTMVKILVNGNPGGSCERAFVNWGDGTSPQPLSGSYPLQASHAYQGSGQQTVKVEAAAGFKCLGTAQGTMYVYPSQGKFTGVTPASGSVKVNEELTLELSGSGICENVTVALGDNLNIINVGAVAFNPYNNFKWPVKVKYGKAGNYTLYVKDNGASACGILNPKVTVAEPLRLAPVFMPPVLIAPPAATAPQPVPKPKAAPRNCAKKNGQQVDPACVED